jgi:hypothetical protein
MAVSKSIACRSVTGGFPPMQADRLRPTMTLPEAGARYEVTPTLSRANQSPLSY